MLMSLFAMFFLVGLVSFGGGYAMIPLIQEEVLNRRGWMEPGQLADIVAVAGMSPGPIATNIAVAVGYREAGWLGAASAAAAVVLPSFVLILAAGKLFFRYRDNRWLTASFYGLRAVVVGMIVYAAVSFAQHAGMVTVAPDWRTGCQLAIFAGSLFALVYLHKHPFVVIILSGLVGIALYG
ncbi:chromate transporter [Cohnella sp. JJ-181]|uniref:chromate transporter n=1 Tax=Cohnella rhizoplanae TaxID=2974897 RepID=UPI0022FF716D|nr:chromate transporter [Cohnella sp. JJ-181]CAI6083757.1 putative chromate transport protein [Cohnella sp. JJ-181]